MPGICCVKAKNHKDNVPQERSGNDDTCKSLSLSFVRSLNVKYDSYFSCILQIFFDRQKKKSLAAQYIRLFTIINAIIEYTQ